MSDGSRNQRDNDRLMKAIVAFADDKEAGQRQGRVLADSKMSSDERLLALLREIDETVLHRCLHFRSGDVFDLKLDVIERRVLRIRSVSNPEETVGCDLVNRPLKGADLSKLYEYLVGYSRSGSDIAVVSRLPEDEDLAVREGVTLDALWRLNTVKFAIAPISAEVSESVVATVSRAIACLVVYQAQELATFGGVRDIEGLRQLVDHQNQSSVRHPVKAWIGGNDGARAVISASLIGVNCLALTAKDDLDAVLNFWKHTNRKDS